MALGDGLYFQCSTWMLFLEKMTKRASTEGMQAMHDLNRSRPETTQCKRVSYLREVGNLKSSGQCLNWTTEEEVNRPQISALRAQHVLSDTVYAMSLETSFIMPQDVLVSLNRKGNSNFFEKLEST